MTDQIIIYRSPTEQVVANMVYDLFSSGAAVWVFGAILLVLVILLIVIERQKRRSRGRRYR